MCVFLEFYYQVGRASLLCDDFYKIHAGCGADMSIGQSDYGIFGCVSADKPKLCEGAGDVETSLHRNRI